MTWDDLLDALDTRLVCTKWGAERSRKISRQLKLSGHADAKIVEGVFVLRQCRVNDRRKPTVMHLDANTKLRCAKAEVSGLVDKAGFRSNAFGCSF